MRTILLFLLAFVTLAVAGCGGDGDGGGGTVTNSQFQVAWPARSRDALPALSSALSARVVFHAAGSGGSNVIVDIERSVDPAAYTGTYTIPGPIVVNQLAGITATFYSQAGQTGLIVGNATATGTLTGGSLQFAAIALTGLVSQVTSTGATVSLGSGTTQLTFTAKNEDGATLAVSPGSATWSVVDGGEFITLTSDGIVTPQAQGTAHVRVNVDGVISAPVPVTVTAPTAFFSWSGQKGGTLGTPSFSAVEGNQFRIEGTQNVVVTMLGYESARPTNPGGITALFDASGAVIASATITGADTLIDGYYYKEIAPITLTAGATYYIGSLHGVGADGACLHNTNTATLPSFATDLGTKFKVSSTIGGGTWQSSGPRHYVGNFRGFLVN